MKEIIAGVILGLLFTQLIISCANAEDNLVNEYCSGLSGYEYGQCQTQIY